MPEEVANSGSGKLGYVGLLVIVSCNFENPGKFAWRYN